jgi:hypothetical protein
MQRIGLNWLDQMLRGESAREEKSLAGVEKVERTLGETFIRVAGEANLEARLGGRNVISSR